MLTGIYIGLRFVHFLSLMVAFGCVLYGAWWAPLTLRNSFPPCPEPPPS